MRRGCDFANFGRIRNSFGPGRRRLRALDLEADQFLVDVALRADALDDLLAEIAAFGEADGMHLLGFLRQGFVENVLAIARLSVFNTDSSGVVRGCGLGPRRLQFRSDVIEFGCGAVDACARLAGLGNASDCNLPPWRLGVIAGEGGSDLRKDPTGARTFHADAGRPGGDIFEFDLIGDDVALY